MFLSKLFGSKKSELEVEVLDFKDIANNKMIMSDLRRLTLFSYSGMNHELNELSNRVLELQKKVNAKVITARRNGKMVGWALLSKEDSDFSFMSGDGYKFDRDGALFEVFVDPKYRRTGIGTELLKTARKHAGPVPLCVAPHDHKSFAFYDKNKKYKQKRI